MSPRIGLVLGAGGVTGGAFHAGVLAALAETTGWDARTAEVIVGTSAGSVAGAVLRAGLPPGDMAARAEGRPLSPEGARMLAGIGPPPQRMPLRPARGDGQTGERGLALARMALRPWGVRPAAVLAALLPAGRVPTAMITEGLDPLFDDRWPDAPLWIVTVRLADGRRVVFGRDHAPRPRVAAAVAASCAIPSYFEPVVIEDERFVDGGVHSPTNLDLMAGLGLDLVVVSSPMSVAGRIARPSADMALRRTCRAFLQREALSVRRRGTPVLAFQPTAEDASVMGINAMDPKRRGDVARQIRSSTARRLERADLRGRLALLS